MLNNNTTAKIRFHWIFSESHHGKGEHDGHGATVKSAIRVFVLAGKVIWKYDKLLNNYVEDHFIDNEQEVYEFLNSGKVKNTKAFVMEMSTSDEEQDCTGVVGSNSMYEFR